MRFGRKNTRTADTELNMAAMIDVVLLLLIFFMCTLSFNKPEGVLKTQIVQAGLSSQVEEIPIEPVRIELGSVAKKLTIYCDNQPCRDFESLAARLSSIRNVADTQVIISYEDEVSYGDIVSAADQCFAAGFLKVGMSAKEPQR